MRIFSILLFAFLVSCESNTPGVSDESFTGGIIMVAIVLGFFFIGGLYAVSDENSKKKKIREKLNKNTLTWDDYYEAVSFTNDARFLRQLESYLNKKDDAKLKKNALKSEENKILYDSDYSLNKILRDLEDNTNQCNKCYNDEMRIWNINKSLVELRCEDCRKKFKYTNECFIDFNLEEIVNAIDLFEERRELEKSNQYIRASAINLNYDGYKRNSPKTYPFILNCDLPPSENTRRKNKTPDDKNSRRIPQEVKDSVWRRDEGKCVECGTNKNLEFDHIIPHSKGGANTYRNVQLLCEKCNREKSDKIG